MAEDTILVILSSKIKEVETYIRDMDARTEAARRDLIHLQASLELFRRGPVDAPPAYMGLGKVFGYGEMRKIGMEALSKAPEGLDTRQLAQAIMDVKGVSLNEKVFRRTVIRSLTVMFCRLERRGLVRCLGERDRVKVWALIA